uniref:G-protein coupled receptors family 1 profile domain-containing protein n=2 Tax=Castor canadensis TaxID=51338 RepID=A0A8C0VY50_CASCN
VNSLISSNWSQMQNERNQNTGVTFTLLGFSEYPDIQLLLFLVFLTIYIVSVLENLDMILIIRINCKLHTPMYFFLSHLSFVDFCYTSVIAPNLLNLLLVEDKTISFKGCMPQYFFGCTSVITEMFMLAVMAYDCFVAVCNPLLYTTAVSHKLCAFLVALTYIWAGIFSSTLTYILWQLSYCGSNITNHFCCEYSALLSVSYSDTSFSQMAYLVISMFNEACCLLIIMTSYVFIVVTVIKIPSKGGLQKAFSTCASHLTAICICHGIVLVLYCVLKSKSSLFLVKVATVFHSMVIPMLNPLIYSLRNKDVKETIRKLIYIKLIYIFTQHS